MNRCLSNRPVLRAGFPSFRRALTLIFLICLSTQLPADDFSAGTEAYQAGRFSEAVDAFHRSIAQEETAAARHNLALALYQDERPAEAVWQLERALQLEPFNQSYHFKLGALRQQMGLNALPRPGWLQSAQIMSFAAWAWMAGLSFWLLLAGLILPRVAGKPPALAWRLISGTSALLLLISLTAMSLQKSSAFSGTVITGSPATLRHAPAAAAPESGIARPGERIHRIEAFQGFLKIKTESDLTGWIEVDKVREF